MLFRSLGLFDDHLCEVTEDSTRYILRRNPARQREIASSREDRLRKATQYAVDQTAYLAEHPRAKAEKALVRVRERCGRYGLDDFTGAELNERIIAITVDEEQKNKAAALDGCYVLRTDLPLEAADAATVHARYKDLALVEKAFRTWKTGHLELRPVYVRSESSTRGHVFVVMLAYLIERELAISWQGLDMTVAEGIDALGALCGLIVTGDAVGVQRIPKPNEACDRLLETADIHLPQVLPLRNGHVATRKKLTERRKNLKNSGNYTANQ